MNDNPGSQKKGSKFDDALVIIFKNLLHSGKGPVVFLGSGDHNMIDFSLQFDKEKLALNEKVSKINFKDMREELARVDYEVGRAGAVEQQWQMFLRFSQRKILVAFLFFHRIKAGDECSGRHEDECAGVVEGSE
eukprot:g38034.t1